MKTNSLSLVWLLSLAALASCDQKPLKEGKLSDYACPDHPYTVHLFSKNPLVIYISNFITPEEAAHLEAITYVS